MVEEIKIDSVEEKKEEQTEDIPQHINDEKEDISKLEENKNQTTPTEVIKEKLEEKTNSEEQEDDSEDLSIDFKELKNKAIGFFKGFKTDKKTDKKLDLKKLIDEDENKDEDISFDFKKVSSFAKNNAKWLIPLILILIAILFSTYFRVMPSYLPITDDWAESTVYNFYQQQISNQINQQYPNLPEQNRQSLVAKEWAKQLNDNKDQINYDIEQLSNQYKANFQDEDGQTYLLAIDPYYWYNFAKWRIENGHWGNSLKDGKGWSYNYNGREGRPMHFEFPSFMIVILFGFWSLFSNISIMKASFYIPAIIIALSLIPAFFMGRRFNGNAGGFFAAIIVAINIALLSRTPAGFSDTDAYQALFPLLICWLFLESFEAKTLMKRIILSLSSGLLIGVYLLAWQGGGFILTIIVAATIFAVVLRLLVNYFKNKDNSFSVIKVYLVNFGIFFLSSTISLFLIAKQNAFKITFGIIQGVIDMKNVATISIWPNVLTTVAEFNVISIKEIIPQMGGNLLAIIALIGIIGLMVRAYKKKESFLAPLLLIVWIIATAYGFTRGMRFAILMVPAFALAFGAGAGLIYNYSSRWLPKNIHISKYLSRTLVIIIICLTLITPLITANNTAINEIPSMNDAWYNTLTEIKENSTDAIITSWWDFGHWFIALSQKRVTFDGANQGERIHWVGKSLLTQDEQLSIGTLRALNCGHEKPVHLLETFLDNDTSRAVELLDNMMKLNNKDAAVRFLKTEGLSTTQIGEIITITYCDDLIEQYYITSEDMVGKAGVWGHFGSWNFSKAKMYQSVIKNKSKGNEILTSTFNLDAEMADEYYYQIITTPADQWISQWPSYLSGLTPCQKITDNNIICNIGTNQGTISLEINLNNMEAVVKNNGKTLIHPKSLVYATKDRVEEKNYENEVLPFSAILIPKGEGYSIILSDPLQASSTFTRLFFFEGHGMKCFSKFNDVIQLTGGRIITWKVDFDCQQQNNVFLIKNE